MAPKIVVTVGATLSAADGKVAAAAVAPAETGTFAGGVRTVDTGPESLTLVLRSGPQVRLGGIGNLRLKLTIARRILHVAAETAASRSYVDVSVPEASRPHSTSLKSKVEVEGRDHRGYVFRVDKAR